jgi:cyclophilin family peptidyl-prolyl cis-trans isomerase
MRRRLPLLLVLFAAVACGKGEEKNPEPEPAPLTKVKFETTAGDFVVEVNAEWAPFGAKRFLKLVHEGYFDECAFFRVMPGFVVQFGLAANPDDTDAWNIKIPDDPVRVSNRRGTMVFATAGPNTRTTQIFINYADNVPLDGDGFAPFAKVISGMENVDRISAAHGQIPNQGQITVQGNAYLKKFFPKLDYVKTARIVK